MTQSTIDFLHKKANTEEKKNAVKFVEKDWKDYNEYIVKLKEVKKEYSKKTKYRSYDVESYQKLTMRAEESIKSLRPYLQTVMSNKNDPIIYYYILSNPVRHWDYYLGTINQGISFSSSLWMRKYILDIFK